MSNYPVPSPALRFALPFHAAFARPFLAAFFLVVAAAARADDLRLEYHGAGWMQMGRVEESFTLGNSNNNYGKNWLGNAGAVLTANTKIDQHWDGALGMGSIMVQLARGDRSQAKKWYPFVVPFVSEARITWSATGYAEQGGLQMSLGAFPYNYSPDAKNLGLYLMRGYVYPGTLVSGFGGIFGAMGRYQAGGFSNDLLLLSETEDKPLFDLSLADVAAMRIHPGLELGAGVNFYRLVPMNGKATSPGRDCGSTDLGPYAGGGQDDPCFLIEKDSAGNPVDTLTGSLAGTKLMARFRLDPKAWFASTGALGKDDLVLYGEAAILGLKNYPQFYDDIKRRIPVMLGLNLPTFGSFGLSVEAEYFASKISSDNIVARNGSWIPAVTSQIDYGRDDWKWSVNASKLWYGHFLWTAQVANDHLRLGGNHDEDTGIEAMRTPEDWYWTSKMAYFF
jgi:hypothetical protein